jgi:hypothetical protein
MALTNGIWWLLLLAPLLFLQRRLHYEIQAVLLLLTRRSEIALMLFAILFFPGVLLHELSHYLMARLLRVRTGCFSLIPRPLPDGRLQLGYVETSSSDLVRDALIGGAPLLAGGIFVAYAGLVHLGLPALWDSLWVEQSLLESQTHPFWETLLWLPDRPDFWLWFYLTFTVSSTMMPSASDRRAWLPLAIVALLLFGLVLVTGTGSWLSASLAIPFERAIRSVAIVLAIAVALHLTLLPPIWSIRRVLTHLTGLHVV